jgi:hypothetical protein
MDTLIKYAAAVPPKAGEKECSRNIELEWLLQGLQPNYHSIADFRKLHAQALIVPSGFSKYASKIVRDFSETLTWNTLSI